MNNPPAGEQQHKQAADSPPSAHPQQAKRDHDEAVPAQNPQPERPERQAETRASIMWGKFVYRLKHPPDGSNMWLTAAGIVAALFVAKVSYDAADAARQANKLARLAIVENRLVFKNGQRAWVSVNFSVTKEPSSAEDLFQFRIDPIVTGNSPALAITSKSLPAMQSAPPQPPDWDSIPTESGTLVSPNQTSRYFTTQAFKLDDDGYRLYTETPKQVHLYLWNRIYYCDVFNRRHWIESCVYHTYGSGLDHVEFCRPGGQSVDANNGDGESADCQPEAEP